MKTDTETKKNATESIFEMTDPFNPQNKVAGIIYRTNDKYGSMLIKTVNGKSCEQFIHATPKFLYPGNSHSSKNYKKGLFPQFFSITIYDKLDGTNIFMFKYKDESGKYFVSFKTRLVPFLKASGFKDWILMWNKMEEKYKEKFDLLKSVLLDANENISGFAFEMYGSANKILVEYPVPLDIAMLYHIDTSGNIHDPEESNASICKHVIPPLKTEDIILPKPNVISKFFNGEDPDNYYSNMIDCYESKFLENESAEGCVFYIQTSEKTIAWKCKPPSVIAAQCEGNKMVGYKDAYTTALNAMESVDSIDDLGKETYALLAETYEEMIIELSKERIDEAIKDARAYVLFRKEVVEKFKTLGLKWNNITLKSSREEKGAVMRPMMKEYKGINPTGVFNALLDYFTVFGE